MSPCAAAVERHSKRIYSAHFPEDNHSFFSQFYSRRSTSFDLKFHQFFSSFCRVGFFTFLQTGGGSSGPRVQNSAIPENHRTEPKTGFFLKGGKEDIQLQLHTEGSKVTAVCEWNDLHHIQTLIISKEGKNKEPSSRKPFCAGLTHIQRPGAASTFLQSLSLQHVAPDPPLFTSGETFRKKEQRPNRGQPICSV